MKSTPEVKYVSLMALIGVIAAAISRWAENYNNSPDRWADFAMRYDLTVSDSRMVHIDIATPISAEEM